MREQPARSGVIVFPGVGSTRGPCSGIWVFGTALQSQRVCPATGGAAGTLALPQARGRRGTWPALRARRRRTAPLAPTRSGAAATPPRCCCANSVGTLLTSSSKMTHCGRHTCFWKPTFKRGAPFGGTDDEGLSRILTAGKFRVLPGRGARRRLPRPPETLISVSPLGYRRAATLGKICFCRNAGGSLSSCFMHLHLESLGRGRPSPTRRCPSCWVGLEVQDGGGHRPGDARSGWPVPVLWGFPEQNSSTAHVSRGRRW